MARKKGGGGGGPNKDAWLATYGDMITLILVFFILLYSMSTIDQEKFRLLVKAFTADPNTLDQIAMEESIATDGFPDYNEATGETEQQEEGTTETEADDMEKLYEMMKEYVEENELEEAVQIIKTDDAVFVRFMSDLFFEANRSVLLADARPILEEMGQALQEVNSATGSIRIVGHTAEASSAANPVDNRTLSSDRANAVLKFLENNYAGIDPRKLSSMGLGMYHPIAANDSEENRKKNRRVEVLISEHDELQEELDDIYKAMDALEQGAALDEAL